MVMSVVADTTHVPMIAMIAVRTSAVPTTSTKTSMWHHRLITVIIAEDLNLSLSVTTEAMTGVMIAVTVMDEIVAIT